MASWISEVYRKLHLDYHQPPWMEGVAEAFTEAEAQRQAKTFKRSGIEAVEFFAYDHYGYAFYPSGIAPVHPGLKNDYTGLMSKALKAQGIRTILYLNAFTSVEMRKLHPEWMRVAEDGTMPRGAWLQHEASHICIASDYLEAFFFPLLREAIARHAPDGVWIDAGSWMVEHPCYCDNCSRRYLEDTGRSLPAGPMPAPSEELDDEAWIRWRIWRRGLIAPYLRRLAETVKAVSPDTLLAENNAGKYLYGIPHVERGELVKWLAPLELGLDWLSCDPVHFGANHEMTFSREGRYQSTTGLPFDYMNERFHGWGEWQMRPPTDWKLELATVLSVGGRFFFADQPHPDGTVEPTVYRHLREVHDYVKPREPFGHGAEPVPDVAVLASLPSQLIGPMAGPEWGRDQAWGVAVPRSRTDRVDGASMLLSEAGIQHLIYDEETMRRSLDRQALVIVPDQMLMEDETIEALERYVETGGTLLVSGRSGLYSERGERRAADPFAKLLGLSRGGELPAPLHYWQAGPELAASMANGDLKLQVWGAAMQVTLAGAEALAHVLEPVESVWAEGVKDRSHWRHYTTVGAAPAGKTDAGPAVTVHRYGRGRAMYVNGEPFALYYLEGHRLTREWLVRGLEELYPAASRRLDADKPLHVELALQERRTMEGAELLVHATNYFAQKRPGYIIHNEEVPPIFGIRLRVRTKVRPSRVTLEPERTLLNWTWDGERVHVELPRLDLHAIVRIETGAGEGMREEERAGNDERQGDDG
ncbi:beta-galactosidase trimerization domain-containing protein [Cohnella nanjingensis]|uniref:Beta-galactosidase trimerization domain-containing protein n=1 Tax=Cohnella nanjingensis TaxID=1387779 RepID=A0A7X0RMN6_9BACL|nr:beta-galactosidase trimerization domain-containing protein [Cohnella nanjingensis]MBB6669121.1 beta-galactosidase trimerization domain-containing protein [Cohnella nanjingensis]